MVNQSTNPYYNLAMIRNIEMFFGRRDLLKHFYSALANRQSVSILGMRRIGKSSFLWCASLPELQSQFPYNLKRHIFIFLDLHDYLHKTSEDFFYRVSREIIKQGVQVPGLTLPAESNGTDTFSGVLDQVNKQGFYPVLLLDSFDKVTLNDHFSPEFFGFLRAQASRGRVSYVTASIKPLYEVCHRGIAGSPFFNIFGTYSLDVFSPKESFDLITIPSQQAGVTFNEAETALAGRLAGLHPFFIQRVCHFLFEEKAQYGNVEIDEVNIERIAYADLLPHFKDFWEQITEAERSYLLYIAREEENRPRKLPALSESALFRKFVRNTCQVGLFDISVKELEAALERISNPKVLGDVSLAHMQTITRRLGNNAIPSTLEKGMVIREALREAFEQLKASGTRRDSDPEWRNYNILYYSYFYQNRMNNDQIAARIGFSTRQYYRERSKAIEALRDILLEMERNVTQ